MRRLIGVGLAAIMLSACGETTPTEPAQTNTPAWGTTETVPEHGDPGLTVSAPGVVAPTRLTLPVGSWVRDEFGSCAEREEWLVIGSNGQLDHVLADRNTCGEPSLLRYAGRWTTDQQIAHLRWANRNEDVDRRATFWSTGDTLQLGAYVAVDGGWHRHDETTREVLGRTQRTSVDIGVRIDDLELRDGATCHMSATVSVERDSNQASEVFEFPCTVRKQGEGFLIVADGMWDDGGWYGYLERRGIWQDHGATLGNAFYAGFQPVLYTVEGEALWHERADSVYRSTDETPPLTTDDLGE